MKDKIQKILNPVERFMHNESTAGLLLLGSAVAAMLWANLAPESYIHMWEYELAIRFGDFHISNSLHHWITDGLMAMFFFVVGLELKREIMAGELSTFRKALLPIIAAVGGMAMPALIYIMFNPSGEVNDGWGIPMATDIAFALGIISLLGSRVPTSLKIFLTALAIADDIGAVLVIAFFYTSEISLTSIGVGAVFIGVLIAGNYVGIRSTLFYGLIGIGGLWLAFLTSGVHATIAGVLAALTIPARTRIDEKKFIDNLQNEVEEFHKIPPNDVTLLEPAQYQVIEKIHSLTKAAGTPLQRLEHQLHPWVSFLIMPLFALSNAGIVLQGEVLGDLLTDSITVGVIAGLVGGKFLGVVLFSWVAIKLKVAELPVNSTWTHVMGVGFMAGVGFTMSLFITTLAFEDKHLIADAKVGILMASLIAGLVGYAILRTRPFKKASG